MIDQTKRYHVIYDSYDYLRHAIDTYDDLGDAINKCEMKACLDPCETYSIWDNSPEDYRYIVYSAEYSGRNLYVTIDGTEWYRTLNPLKDKRN